MKRQGFATLVALVLITLVGMAAVAMSSRFSAEARRTRDALAEAQLRQLLIAGARHAQASAGRWEHAAELTLPQELPGGVEVTAEVEGDSATVLIEASLDGRIMRQRLRWSGRAGQWTLLSAELGG